MLLDVLLRYLERIHIVLFLQMYLHLKIPMPATNGAALHPQPELLLAFLHQLK